MGKTILIFAEQREGKLRQVSIEALQVAKMIGGGADDRYVAAILGNGVSVASRKLAAYDVHQVIAVDHHELDAYNPDIYGGLAERIAREVGADVIIMGHTSMGRDLAPTLAARLGAGLVSDITAVEKQGEEVRFTRPIYAGKAFEQRVISCDRWVVTVRANNIPAAQLVEADAPIVSMSVNLDESIRTTVRRVVREAVDRVDLTEARIVVSGGRGVKSEEGFRVLEELAEVLGGAVGASRGACDAGYCDYALQIGQTGKVVTPDVYIACGISGAIQHLAGMSQSRVIIAINTDPDAPIFQVADYGIVGDLFEVVPMLTQAFKDLRASASS